MAIRYRITSGCESCGACLPVCPLGAITEEPYAINEYVCNGCGDCADACPYEAIESYEWVAPVMPICLLPMTMTMTLKISEEV